jgi:hypothetical protein
MAGLSKKLDPLSKKLHPIGVDLPTEVGGFSLAIFGICGPCEDIAEDIAIISVMQAGYGHAALLIIFAVALAYSAYKLNSWTNRLR